MVSKAQKAKKKHYNVYKNFLNLLFLLVFFFAFISLSWGLFIARNAVTAFIRNKQIISPHINPKEIVITPKSPYEKFLKETK